MQRCNASLLTYYISNLPLLRDLLTANRFSKTLPLIIFSLNAQPVPNLETIKQIKGCKDVKHLPSTGWVAIIS